MPLLATHRSSRKPVQEAGGGRNGVGKGRNRGVVLGGNAAGRRWNGEGGG